MGRIPERTCIGCRRVVPSSELVRLVAPSGVVVAAARRGGRAMPRQGRGAWLHPKAECVSTAINKRVFGRAFRSGVDGPDPARLLDDLRVATMASFHEQGESK